MITLSYLSITFGGRHCCGHLSGLDMSDHTPPVPRLRHCPPGATIRLAGELRYRIILSMDGHYAYFAGGDKASLCCLVAEDGMVFGEGGGWRIKERA
ncbi:MAG TPA: hypothetical protein VNS29_04010 [Burkholderiaceae bacterium]|nr:hypothetical protein [Burkholderiaceae bacterium]